MSWQKLSATDHGRAISQTIRHTSASAGRIHDSRDDCQTLSPRRVIIIITSWGSSRRSQARLHHRAKADTKAHRQRPHADATGLVSLADLLSLALGNARRFVPRNVVGKWCPSAQSTRHSV
jgi:hypothetical protein